MTTRVAKLAAMAALTMLCASALANKKARRYRRKEAVEQINP